METCSYKKCKKRLSIVDSLMNCRCNLKFCPKHRPAEKHKCTFDYKSLNKMGVKIEKTYGLDEKI